MHLASPPVCLSCRLSFFCPWSGRVCRWCLLKKAPVAASQSVSSPGALQLQRPDFMDFTLCRRLSLTFLKACKQWFPNNGSALWVDQNSPYPLLTSSVYGAMACPLQSSVKGCHASSARNLQPRSVGLEPVCLGQPTPIFLVHSPLTKYSSPRMGRAVEHLFEAPEHLVSDS